MKKIWKMRYQIMEKLGQGMVQENFPSVEEMEIAAQVFVLCVKLVSVNKLLADMGN